MSTFKKRSGHRAFRRARAALIESGADTCWLCGQFIDMNLKTPDPGSWEADHVTALKHGGSEGYGEIRPAHRACNQARNRRKPPPPTRHARDWNI